MTSAILQIIAAITMLIDHIGYWIPNIPEFFRYIGRIAFPIFAMLFAEGFRHTSSRKKYFARLLLFAFVSQAVVVLFYLVKASEHLEPNVMFLFCSAFLLLSCLEKKRWWLLLTLPIFELVYFLKVEYGVLGLLLIVAFYYLHKVKAQPARLICTFLILFAFGGLYYWTARYVMHLYYVLATPFIGLYNGKKGARLPRYFLYIYYPAHQLVLVMIRLTLLSF